MAGLFNRLKGRKTGSINENEPTTLSLAFDEEGFLCPLCHQKFPDQKQLAQHYTDTHAGESTAEKKEINNNTSQKEIQKDSIQEIELWKQQFTASEESRILLTNALMNEKQHTSDLEEELQMLQKHLKTTQAKVAEQSQEIANFKATKDVYNAQLTIFSDELLNAQNLLKEKQQQIDVLSSKASNDDVDLLQRELITIQQHMNDVAMEKEAQLEKLRSALRETEQCYQRLDQIGTTFHQNLSIYDEIIGQNPLPITSEMKGLLQLTREQVQKTIQSMRTRLIENQTEIVQLNHQLDEQKLSNDKIINDLQKQTNSSRHEIESFNKEIVQYEKHLVELKEERNRLIQSQMNGDQNDERQNLLRQITIEKDQYEQQLKDCRIQIKQINNERQQIRDELDQITQQYSSLSNEKTKLQNEIDSLKSQLDKDKERRIGEVSTMREQYITIEKNLREANELNNIQKRELDRIKTDQEQLANRTKMELILTQKEKEGIVQQLQTTLAQLHGKLDEREARIKRLSFGIHRSVATIRRTDEHIKQNIHAKQMNILSTIEKAKEDCRLTRAQTREEIQEEFKNYLTTIHTIILDSKNTLEKQMEKSKLDVVEQEEQVQKIQVKYTKLSEEHRIQKEKFEIQLGEMNRNLSQVSESLSESTQKFDRQREKYEKQITAFEREVESRTKRHEMQLTALTENLATVRTELKLNQEKLATIDQIKSDKADIEARLVVSQDERRVLLERSLALESKGEKLLADNGQLTKKATELEAALQEIAREYQALQIQADKLRQRRWLDDEDVDACMKCQQIFSVTQRKHHCRNCGNIFCDNCSSKTANIAAASRKQKRVCDQCYKDLTV